MKLHLIVNPRARRHANSPELASTMRKVAAGRAVVHETATLEDLDHLAHELAQQKAELVALSGGDGSFMAGLTALARAYGEANLPKLALLPGGTATTVALNWGTRGDPIDLLERLLSRPLVTVRRPSLRVLAEQPGGSTERLGFIFGTGLVAKFFRHYEADGARGYGAAARLVSRIFVQSFYGGAFARSVLDPLPCTLEVDGRALEPRAWSLVCCSVLQDLGIGMRVTYRAGEDFGRPHLVASPLSSGRLGPRAPLVLLGKRIGGAGHFDDLVTRFAVRFPSADEGPFVLDGDIFRAERVTVSAGPALDVALTET